MKTDKAGIYVDCYNLRKKFYQATYEMTHKDRVIIAEKALKDLDQVISSFVMGYEFQEERMYYIKKMSAHFEVLKMDLRIMAEENVFKGKKNKTGEYVLVEREIFELVARIDDGIGKWRQCYFDERKVAILPRPGYTANDILDKRFHFKKFVRYDKTGTGKRNQCA